MEEDIGAKNDVVLQIAIPYADAAKEGLEVYRYHGNAASTLKSLTAKPSDGFVDGTFFADTANKYLFIYAKDFSTYAVGYTTPAAPYTSTYSSGSSTTYTIGACPQDATCPISAFSDADPTAWYHDGVHWALDNGVMNGVGDNLFAPNGNTSRAMIVTMLWRMEGSPAYAGASEFTDVGGDTWYTEAVRWASTEGIVTGYENPDDAGMIFNPNGAVTREQLATMLYRYAQYKKADVSASASLSSYGDAASVSSWAASAMQWAVGSGIINGIDGNLVPAGNATRAQVATMLMRYSTSAAK